MEAGVSPAPAVKPPLLFSEARCARRAGETPAAYVLALWTARDYKVPANAIIRHREVDVMAERSGLTRRAVLRGTALAATSTGEPARGAGGIDLDAKEAAYVPRPNATQYVLQVSARRR
mgnify:CR=1 FL=1